MSRAPTPVTAHVGLMIDQSIDSILDKIQAQVNSLGSSAIRGANWPPQDTFSRIVLSLDLETSWGAIKKLAIRLLGEFSFGLGVAVGFGEELIGSVVDLARLIKIFILADFYDRLHAPNALRYASPSALLGYLAAQAAGRLIPAQLKDAHDQRDGLVDEVKKIFADPGSFFRSIKQEYVEKYNRFVSLFSQSDLKSQYEAGKIFGSILLDILALIGAGEAIAKAAAKLPNLFKWAKRLEGKLPRTVKLSTVAGMEEENALPKPKVNATGGGMRDKYKTTPMNKSYLGENRAGNDIWGTPVKYLSDEERAMYKLQLRDGKIYDSTGQLFDTGDAVTAHSGQGRAIFTMDESGNFYASKFQQVGEFHHSSLGAGQPVAAAGEIQVDHGVLQAISDKSGHYLPGRAFTQQALDSLQRSGIDLSSVSKDFIGR